MARQIPPERLEALLVGSWKALYDVNNSAVRLMLLYEESMGSETLGKEMLKEMREIANLSALPPAVQRLIKLIVEANELAPAEEERF